MSPINGPIPVKGTCNLARNSIFRLSAVVLALILCVAADGSWLKHVPDSYRRRMNPYEGKPEAIEAGSRLFADHCAKCHGDDALGRDERPNLRSDRVQQATPGEISWLLKNGNLSRGMPSWSSLPEPSRWQIIAYVKSLGPAAPPDAPAKSSEEKTK